MQNLHIQAHTASSPQIAYICFDVVPSPKGAAIHIQAFAHALATHWSAIHLVTVSADRDFKQQAHTLSYDNRESHIHHTELPALGKTLIDRVLYFRQQLRLWLQGRQFDVIHIRSIYEGLPIAQNKAQYCRKLLFEVNGLPSIELKYRYPKVADDRELLKKLQAQEALCLQAADHIITPSPVTQKYLTELGITAQLIDVIPNGIDRDIFSLQPQRSWQAGRPLKLIYFGTFASWQGVNLAVEALELYNKTHPAELTLIGSGRPDQIKALTRLIHRLNVSDRVTLLPAQTQSELAPHIAEAHVVLAPLTLCDRNIVQGCCPLKVLEGMAMGRLVITSDLPVVQAIAHPKQHLIAVRPNSATAIAQALIDLTPEQIAAIGQQAAAWITQHYTWERAGITLNEIYTKLIAF